MTTSRNLVLLGLLGGLALASNPDEQSFQRYIDRSMKKEGSHWLERKVVSHMSALVYERKDFKLFSVVNVPENETVYLGIFGVWLALPNWAAVRRMRTSSNE